jgi:sporulation protein YlmC with PRC-barrel domain
MSEEARGAQELMGLPVLTIAEGKHLGTISRLLVHREVRSLVAVGIGGGGFSHPSYLRYSQLSTIGADAVMVASEAVLKEGIPPEEIGELDSSVLGRPVVTDHGQKLGEVAGFTANTGTGRIEAFRVRPEAAGLARLAAFVHLGHPETVELPDALVVSLGDSALIVRDEATSLWQHGHQGQSVPSPDDPGGPSAA